MPQMIKLLIGSPKRVFVLGLLGCVGLLATAYVLEHFFYVVPCPLCLMQRGVIVILGILFLVALIYPGSKPWWRYVYGIKVIIFSSLGLGLTIRQLYLEHLPREQLPECIAGFNRLLQLYPVMDVLDRVLKGSGQCGEVTFTLLGLSLAHWSFLSFSGFIALGIGIVWLQKKRWS